MTKEELVEIVIRIRTAEGTEDEIDQLMDKFEANVPDPKAGNYLIESKYDDLSPEEIVEKALSYKPFSL